MEMLLVITTFPRSIVGKNWFFHIFKFWIFIQFLPQTKRKYANSWRFLSRNFPRSQWEARLTQLEAQNMRDCRVSKLLNEKSMPPKTNLPLGYWLRLEWWIQLSIPAKKIKKFITFVLCIFLQTVSAKAKTSMDTWARPDWLIVNLATMSKRNDIRFVVNGTSGSIRLWAKNIITFSRSKAVAK